MPKTKMPPSAPFRSAVEVRTRQYIDSKVAEEVEKNQGRHRRSQGVIISFENQYRQDSD